MNRSIIAVLGAASCILALAACSSNTRTEQAYGDAVRQVTASQVYDTNAASNPDPAAVLGGDPERLNNTLEGHRQDVASPAGVGSSPININVGGSSN